MSANGQLKHEALLERLHEANRELEDYKAQKQLELERLYKELAKHERQRREQHELLAHDNNDLSAMTQANQAEDKIETLKAEMNTTRRDGSEELHRMRREILSLQQQIEGEFKRDLADARFELDTIQNESIPETQSQLGKLEGRKDELRSLVLILSGKVSELQRSELDTVDLELPF